MVKVYNICISTICCNRISLNAMMKVVAALQPKYRSKHVIDQCLDEAYYHRATFLQLNTIDFLLLFPHPSVPSEISGSWGNIFEPMSAFLSGDIVPIIHCNRLQRVLDLPFCNLPNCQIQSPTKRRAVFA